MNPRSRFRLINTDPEEVLEIDWIGFHPGDLAEEVITSTVLQSPDTDISKIVVIQGQVIYIRWWNGPQLGISISMDAILDDFYKIGIDTYNWSKYTTHYFQASPNTWDELGDLLAENHDDEEIEKIPKEIHREWFDIALKSGTFILQRGSWDYHFNVANLFGFFPWIIFFGTGGSLTEETFEFVVEIKADFTVDEDDIFSHVDGHLDEQFWILIYQFVLQLDEIDEEKRGDTWFRFIQAVHEFTTKSSDYLLKLENMFNYKDLLSIFDTSFISSYVRGLLMNIADERPTPSICTVLLEFSIFLLDFNFTDLARLTEATTLEHALKLQDHTTKKDVILELTQRSGKWGGNHLISFIQSLIGLLPRDESGNEILSDAINVVLDQLRQSWDGLLCIVEAKIAAGRIGEAIEIRFEATNQIGDRQTKCGDIFSSLIWSLDYSYVAQDRHNIAVPYLRAAMEHLYPDSIIDQCDVVIQTCLSKRNLDYLILFLGFLREELPRFQMESHQLLLERIEELLSLSPSSPRVSIEFLLLKLYALSYNDRPIDPDLPFQLVSDVFNNVNPALSTSVNDLQHISELIIEYALLSSQWSLVQETRMRYLLLAADNQAATNHLKLIFFNSSSNRANLSAEKLTQNDIGIQMFNEGLKLADMTEDYLMIMEILPQIKKLAVKSRSYSAMTELILTDVRLKRLQSLPWFDKFKEDLEIIIRRVTATDMAMVFAELFRMDLSDEERRTILALQLDLTETEPDLLSADEIYNKRQELAQLSGDSAMQHEFMIENYQKGVSELMSKGDTSNLTNLLLDAINYSQTTDATIAEEFKEILLDNFENITQDVRLQTQPNLYLYLLSIWRKIIENFASTDFTMVLNTGVKLLSLNNYLMNKSDNNQYLRRAQLVLKELSLVASTNEIRLTEEESEKFIAPISVLFNLLGSDQEDFGIFSAISQSAMFYHGIGRSTSFFPLLDHGINQIKQQILADKDAQSSIFLVLLILSELNVILDADLHDTIQQELLIRISRVLTFAQSLTLEQEIAQKLVDLQKTIRSSDPAAFFHEYPFTLGQYLSHPIWT